jgi:hypothetical protein
MDIILAPDSTQNLPQVAGGAALCAGSPLCLQRRLAARQHRWAAPPPAPSAAAPPRHHGAAAAAAVDGGLRRNEVDAA